MRAAIYARISDDRGGTGLGVARQDRDCREFCGHRHWTVTETFVENDVSAFGHRRRPLYRQLLAGINEGRFDALVVWHPDRLHRSPVELEEFIALVEATGLVVASVCAGDYDLGTPEGRLTARIVGSVARKESEDKSRRLRRKHVELAEAGKVSGGGHRPFGYEADRRTVRPAEAAEIVAAAARARAGDSLRSIVLDWQARGVQTVTGAAWSATTVKRLLSSARISGQREHLGRGAVPAEWPAIIDPEDTVRLRAIFADPGRDRRPDGATVRGYLLSGFVACGGCGVRMTARPVLRKGLRYRRYACAADRGGCGRCGIGSEPLEELVVEAVMRVLDGPELARKVARRRRAAPVPAADDVAGLESRLTELAEMYAAGEISRSEWATARAGLDQRLAEARVSLASVTRAEVVDPWVGKAGALRAEWGAMTLDRRRAVLATIIERVDIARTTKANNRFDPSRVSIAWAV